MITLGEASYIGNYLEAEARVVNGKDLIRRVLTDSRSLEQTEGTMFFALKTRSGDGHRYLCELYAKGVRNFVVEAGAKASLEADLPEANIYRVANTLDALQRLASIYRESLNLVVGITGSFGKTIVKEFIYQLLQEDKHVARSPKSYNSSP